MNTCIILILIAALAFDNPTSQAIFLTQSTPNKVQESHLHDNFLALQE